MCVVRTIYVPAAPQGVSKGDAVKLELAEFGQ